MSAGPALNHSTSIFARKSCMSNAVAREVLPNNNKRIGLIIPSTPVDASFSFNPNVVLWYAMFNMYATVSTPLQLSYLVWGTALTQPLYGICGGEGLTVEICEILYDGPPESLGVILGKKNGS
jgi:hypothetical protein